LTMPNRDRFGGVVSRGGPAHTRRACEEDDETGVRQACELLLQVNARVLGIVLNALTWDSAESYYYYGGRYSDRYYHEGSQEDKPADTVSKVS
jgi:hypothetical protein